MPSTLCEPAPALAASLTFWFYRISGFVLLNLVDDPAWLALMFC